MTLDEYVNAVLTKRAWPTSFPVDLELPAPLAGDFYRLYDQGERRGIEVGYNMIFNDGVASIDKSNLFEGGAYYVDLKNNPENSNFADVHSHPANSIGHVKGYAAHSLMDIRGIDNSKEKPLFIRFVAAGNYCYAVVYRNGHSTIDLARFIDLISEQEQAAEVFFLQKNGMTEKDYFDLKNKDWPSDRVYAMHMLNMKKKTPGLGPEMQRLSVKYCKQVAEEMKLGFYQGYRGWYGWMMSDTMKLTLQ